MADVRYTAIGQFSESNKLMKLKIGIPKDTGNLYKFKHYDLTSKLASGEILNVIMSNLIFGEYQFDALATHEYEAEICLKSDHEENYMNIKYRDARIDLKQTEILFLLVHDDQLSDENIREIKGNVSDYYNKAKKGSCFISEAYPKELPIVSGKPRTLGMSIIKN